MKYFYLVLVSFLLSSCSKYSEVQLEALDRINAGAVIIDVRTKEEFKKGHLQNAINVEYENTPLLIKVIGSNMSKSVVLYCRSGRRASTSLFELKKIGYTNIFNGESLIKLLAAKEASLKSIKAKS